MAVSFSSSFLPQTSIFSRRTFSTSPRKTTQDPRVSAQARASLSDPFVLQLADTLEDSIDPSPSPPSLLQKLRDASSESLLSASWPSRKDEPFRFTDLSFLRHSQICPISQVPESRQLGLPSSEEFPILVFIDGHFIESLSNLTELPSEVYVGNLSSLSSGRIMKKVSEHLGNSEGDMFWSLNGLGAPDLTVVYVPEDCKVENPIQLRYNSVESCHESSKKWPMSNPRVLVLVEKGGEICVVEEFMGGAGSRCYWANSVLEVVVGEGAKVRHCYLQTQSFSAAHIKWTWVRQESTSTYELVEISTGGKLSRHNVHVQQMGPDTMTDLTTSHLAVGDQVLDLHSRIVLDHPRGYSRQLHKCIVAHSLGQAVFDGNVRVNRFAQQTDAGQLTRTLLLEPRATVNVKPNLQIIADDVKCSHGAAISDLDEDQLFYLRARGIDIETARKALIFSFGAQVIEKLPYAFLKKKVETHIKELLEPKLKGSSR